MHFQYNKVLKEQMYWKFKVAGGVEYGFLPQTTLYLDLKI